MASEWRSWPRPPKQGSWISITEDNQGRIILGANEQQPFTRLTLDKAGKV